MILGILLLLPELAYRQVLFVQYYPLGDIATQLLFTFHAAYHDRSSSPQ